MENETNLLALLELCEKYRVKKIIYKEGVLKSVCFFKKVELKEPMKLDGVSIAKAFSDSMPPDSAMLFASSEDVHEDMEKKIENKK